MAQLQIQRAHQLGLAEARERAYDWADQAEREYGLGYEYFEGEQEDRVVFNRPGVSGELHVSADRFDLQAELGFLLSAYKRRIEAHIAANLDKLLNGPPGR